jgi:hypothetical protein
MSKNRIKKTDVELFTKHINHKIQKKNSNSYSPELNDVTYLVVISCDCDTIDNANRMRNNLEYFNYNNIHKIIINSNNSQYKVQLEEVCLSFENTSYYETNKLSYGDYGKWCDVLLNMVDYSKYNYILLTNDSYRISSSINHYFNLMYKFDVDIYGYNDSTECNYHVQSYLFALKQEAVQTFITHINDIKINNKKDIIDKFELKMLDWFDTHDSFLTIGNYKINEKKNIFSGKNKLYVSLKNSGLLPFEF